MDVVKDSLLKASALTLLMLVLGVLIGLQMDSLRQDHLTEELRQSNLETETFSVLESYTESSDANHCELLDVQIPEIGDRNAQLGARLQQFEAQNLGSEEEYRYIRDRYYNNQLRLYTNLRSYQDRCGEMNQTAILFFFDSSTQSTRQGSVLNEIVEQNNIQVFSFNAEVDDSIIVDVLKQDYNVTEYPTIVVDEEKYEGYVSTGELNNEIIE